MSKPESSAASNPEPVSLSAGATALEAQMRALGTTNYWEAVAIVADRQTRRGQGGLLDELFGPIF